MADLAVLVVSWNVCELLCVCLRSLLDDLERSGLEAEVWVVDNASTDGSPERVAEEFPAVHLVALPDNVGFTRANNLVLRDLIAGRPSHWRYVWLLNPDTEVLPGATRALVEWMEREPRAGIVGPQLLYGDGSLQHSAFRFPGLVQLAFELFRLPQRLYDTPVNGRYAAHRYARGRPFAVDHPLGAAMLVRLEAVSQVGLLDEGFTMYCEEIDWCWRMRRAGWRAYCVPQARVVHHGGRSAAQTPVSSFVRLWTSRARLYAFHHGPVTRRLARAMVRIGLRRRARTATPALRAACHEIVAVWEPLR